MWQKVENYSAVPKLRISARKVRIREGLNKI